MEDRLAVIKRIIAEHQNIRAHVKLVGDSVSDREALAALQKSHADFIPGRPEVVSDKCRKIQQTILSLEEGLKNHFFYEEKALPPMLGELLGRALVLEHSEISREIDEVKSMVGSTDLEGLNRDELLHQESHIQQMIDSVSCLIEEHADREEAVLEMLSRALQSKKS